MYGLNGFKSYDDSNTNPKVSKLVSEIVVIIKHQIKEQYSGADNENMRNNFNYLASLYLKSQKDPRIDIRKVNRLYLHTFLPNPYNSLYVKIKELDDLLVSMNYQWKENQWITH